MLQEGDVCKHNTFVVEGCFKMYMETLFLKQTENFLYLKR